MESCEDEANLTIIGSYQLGKLPYFHAYKLYNFSVFLFLFFPLAGMDWNASSDTTAMVWRGDSSWICSKTFRRRP